MKCNFFLLSYMKLYKNIIYNFYTFIIQKLYCYPNEKWITFGMSGSISVHLPYTIQLYRKYFILFSFY